MFYRNILYVFQNLIGYVTAQTEHTFLMNRQMVISDKLIYVQYKITFYGY